MKHPSSAKKPNATKTFALLMLSLVLIQPIVMTTPVNAETKTVIKPNDNTIDTAEEVTEGEAEEGAEVETEESLTAEEIFNNSLASARMPGETELSIANQKLLTENAKLEREINDLETQVNVLVNERSGQLYLYGVATALGSFITGGLFGWLVFNRRKKW